MIEIDLVSKQERLIAESVAALIEIAVAVGVEPVAYLDRPGAAPPSVVLAVGGRHALESTCRRISVPVVTLLSHGVPGEGDSRQHAECYGDLTQETGRQRFRIRC